MVKRNEKVVGFSRVDMGFPENILIAEYSNLNDAEDFLKGNRINFKVEEMDEESKKFREKISISILKHANVVDIR